MDGPEQLEIGAPRAPRRRRRWLELGAALLVVAGLGVVRAAGLSAVHEPAPTPPTRAASDSSSPQPWPVGAGLPAGTLFVLANEGVYTVDAGSGLVTKSHAEVDTGESMLTPMSGGVLLWSDSGHPQARLLAYGSRDPREVDRAVGGANTFLPGPDGRVWAARVDQQNPARQNAWRLMDDAGRVTARADVQGYALADGSGGIFGVDDPTVRHVYPEPERWRDVDVLATGPDGYKLLRCAGGRCAVELHDRNTGATTAAGPIDPPSDPGALSPGNRFVASVSHAPTQDNDNEELRVAQAGSGALLSSFPTGAYGTTAVWLSDRWLLATSDLGLVLYDAVDDVLLRPVVPIDAVRQLVWQPA